MKADDPESAPILLVEDEAGFRHIMAMMLSQAGFHVVEAGNGAEALRLLKATPAALVVTDIVMPDMEGMELIRKLRQSPSGPRTLADSQVYGVPASAGPAPLKVSYFSVMPSLLRSTQCPAISKGVVFSGVDRDEQGGRI